MSNELAALLKEIKFKTDLTIEQIAEKIHYSREHLTKLVKKGDNETIRTLLLAEFGNILSQNVSDPNKAIYILVESNNKLAEAQSKFADSQKDLTASNLILASNIDKLISSTSESSSTEKPPALSEYQQWVLGIVDSLDNKALKSLGEFLSKLQTGKPSNVGSERKRS